MANGIGRKNRKLSKAEKQRRRYEADIKASFGKDSKVIPVVGEAKQQILQSLGFRDREVYFVD